MTMHSPLRWLGIALIALAIGADRSVSVDGTPAPATPASPTVYPYRPDQPIILISSGPMTATLHVDRLPTDRYGAVTVATDSDDPFRFTVTPPQGEIRTVFAADSPDAFTGALLLDQTGDYILTVESTGSWALIIR